MEGIGGPLEYVGETAGSRGRDGEWGVFFARRRPRENSRLSRHLFDPEVRGWMKPLEGMRRPSESGEGRLFVRGDYGGLTAVMRD